MKEIAERRL